MTIKQINKMLQAQHGATIQPGYNYVIFSVFTNQPEFVAALIRQHKSQIESRLGHPLLPFACYIRYSRRASVLVPIPFDASLNVLSEALSSVLAGTDARIPSWS